MAKSAFDTLRALAIASQALGFILIITLETLMGDAARPCASLPAQPGAQGLGATAGRR